MGRKGGSRRKRLGIFEKKGNAHGKISIRSYLQEFSSGDKVLLKLEPSVQKGHYFPRFHGKTAVIVGKQGGCYRCGIQDGNKAKEVIVHPVHLKRINNA